jgi:SagB-type dehydrogenase family enzyme
MRSPKAFFRLSELDRTSFPEFRDRALRVEDEGVSSEPRSYPGYPHWPLERLRPRLWPALDRMLAARRSVQVLGVELPSRRTLSRILQFAHGINADRGRGPVPSAGGLQALELYLVALEKGWLPAGLYHYDRAAHLLAQVAAGAERREWAERVPAMQLVGGGALLWVLVGDAARVERKYGERAYRFLLLEAGHLLQNLCLLSASLGLATVPLGGYLEQEVARAFVLSPTDVVLYVGICGNAKK